MDEEGYVLQKSEDVLLRTWPTRSDPTGVPCQAADSAHIVAQAGATLVMGCPLLGSMVITLRSDENRGGYANGV